MNNMQIKFKKTHPNAILPKQGKLGDAGFDLFCVEDFRLGPGERQLVSTGLQLADMPTGIYGSHFSFFLQIEGRSGLAAKGIIPLGGIIDATYRGDIKVILQNLNQRFYSHIDSSSTVLQVNGDKTVSFKAGDRIAQLLIRVIVTSDGRDLAGDVEMLEADDVTETARGDAGFGSTGQ
jgi:dUTP pyrophosphatase